MGLRSDGSDPVIADLDLGSLIRRDQLEAVRRSTLIALPVNAILGLTAALVAIHAGRAQDGMMWFAASVAVNLMRVGLCRADCPALAPAAGADAAAGRSIDRHLRLASVLSLSSGLVWACLPALCDGYTSPHTMFYLTLTCGITAGAVTYGTAFARNPVCFIAPPLLAVVACLLRTGGFDRTCLAAIVILFLGALIRGACLCEAGFRETSRLKNEATALARSRAAAHASASALAEEMRRRATHDDLTGLLNRAGFLQTAQEKRAAHDGPLCLMLLDLDGFKSVNDVYGHQMGDRVLIEVARRLCAVLPERTVAARLGGDEFALVFDPDRTGVSPARLARTLIEAISRPFETFDAGRLGASVGIHQASEATLTQMLSCADEALYAAKGSGRNRFRLFDEGLRSRLEMRRDSERDLPQALAEGALQVWFQPIYGPDGRTLAGLEALVRWRHPQHGWVAPPDLIAAAAMAGQTETLLRFILDESCAMMQALRARGFAAAHVAMNVSPREMAQVAVDEIVLARLRALRLPPAMLEIEITEETALDIAAVQGKLVALSQAGVRVAIDDFGVGYSSLASLRQLRAHRIKIDRSIVTGLTVSDDKRGLVQSVLGLGRLLDLEVVAEGVETVDDLSTLQALGCPFMQGYHLGRPMPAPAVLEILDAPLQAVA